MASELLTLPIRQIPIVSAGNYYVIAQLSGPDSVFDRASDSNTIAIYAGLSITNVTATTLSSDVAFDTGKITFDLVNNSNSNSKLLQSDSIGVLINASDTEDGVAELSPQPSAVNIELAAGRREQIAITLYSIGWTLAQSDKFLFLQLDDSLGDVIAQTLLVLTPAEVTP